MRNLWNLNLCLCVTLILFIFHKSRSCLIETNFSYYVGNIFGNMILSSLYTVTKRRSFQSFIVQEIGLAAVDETFRCYIEGIFKKIKLPSATSR